MTDISRHVSLRRAHYGPYDSHAALAQVLKQTLREHFGTMGWGRMSAAQKQGAERICDKLAGILNGDPDNIGAWLDMAGTCQRVAESIEAARAKRVVVPGAK